MMPIHIREALASDIPFIFNSWLSVMRAETPKDISNDIFFSNHHKLVEKALMRSRTCVAVNPEDHNQIYGFIVGTKKPCVLHFAYVKGIFRRMGIANQLISTLFDKEKEAECSQKAFGIEFISRKIKTKFNPYLIFQEPPHETPKEN